MFVVAMTALLMTSCAKMPATDAFCVWGYKIKLTKNEIKNLSKESKAQIAGINTGYEKQCLSQHT